MYSRTNMMLRRFGKCSMYVKLRLFRSNLCLYGTALWSKYNASTLLQFKYCYHKCIKMFFVNAKYHSITDVLVLLDLQLLLCITFGMFLGWLKMQDMKLQDKIVLGLHYITMKCVVVCCCCYFLRHAGVTSIRLFLVCSSLWLKPNLLWSSTILESQQE